jgi:penicillin-binding protein 2
MGCRVRALAAITLLGFLVVTVQLWYLQVLEGPRLNELSDRNRIRLRPVPAPRGILYDRHGVPLVEPRPSFVLSIVPRELEDRDAILVRLSILLKIPVAELQAAVDAVAADPVWPVRIRRNLRFEEVMRIEEWRAELPGVVVEVEPTRGYIWGGLAAHLLGYVREANREQVQEGRYRPGDLVGQSGLEQLLDEFLRGRDGSEEIEVDTAGRAIRPITREEPRAGANVVSTVDRRIQQAAERALGNARGAVVVMDPRNGDLLAVVSAPAFDLTRFTGPIGRDEWLRLVRDPAHPLLNRAFQSEYPPGSVFKLVVAAAALQEGVVRPLDRLPCPPSLDIGGRAYRNWKDEDLGRIDLRRAIAVSCNTFFYRLASQVGIERIAQFAEAFGLGRPTAVALPGEKSGSVPRVERGRTRSGHRWRPGDTANVSIGQGTLLVTPIQVARFMAALANGGMLWRPRLILRLHESGGETRRFPPELAGRVDISPAVLGVLRQSLWSAVNEGGTGGGAAVPGLAVAGKTGTAQLVRDSDSRRGENHAWFAGYAPADDPQVVVVVLVERGGTGGRVAAPIAGEIFREIFPDAGGGAAIAFPAAG